MVKDIAFGLYELSWKLQKYIMENFAGKSENTSIWWKNTWLWEFVLPIIFVIIAVRIGDISSTIRSAFATFAFLSILIGLFIAINADFLYSLTHFLSIKGKPGFAIYVVAVLFLIFLFAFSMFFTVVGFGFLHDNRSIFIVLSLIILVLGVLYTVLVLLANARVSTIINDAASIIVLALLEVKNAVFSIFPFLPIESKAGTLPNGVTVLWSDVINVFFYVYFFPLLVLFVLGSLLARGKKYWVERYNDGRDIEYVFPNAENGSGFTVSEEEKGVMLRVNAWQGSVQQGQASKVFTMLKRIDLRNASYDNLAEVLPRAELDVEAALGAVRPIIDDVRARGGAALRDIAERFDGVRPEDLRVPAEALKEAADQLKPEIREALKIAIDHNRKGHTIQLPKDTEVEIVPGGIVRQRWIPVSRVGLYVPGGLAVYPSSVVMNVCAAQVAGVGAIALASPPQKEYGGLPHPTILAACYLLGIDEVYAVGGAQAIAMFAYGAKGEVGTSDGDVLCQQVDVVTGPGNIYVAAAKRAVLGVVGIDAEAGPTEIGIVADENANPEYVAADMISQAEHDPNAGSVLFTHSEELASAVDKAIEQRAKETKHTERIHTALTGSQSAIVLTNSKEQSLEAANAYGAEHLEIHTANPREDAQKITNAGAIFVGEYNPVPLGDYLAGSNHVLPTGGTARFASGLNVMAFIKSVQEIEYTREAMTQMYDPLKALAIDEDLPAHAQALQARLD